MSIKGQRVRHAVLCMVTVDAAVTVLEHCRVAGAKSPTSSIVNESHQHHSTSRYSDASPKFVPCKSESAKSEIPASLSTPTGT